MVWSDKHESENNNANHVDCPDPVRCIRIHFGERSTDLRRAASLGPHLRTRSAVGGRDR